MRPHIIIMCAAIFFTKTEPIRDGYSHFILKERLLDQNFTRIALEGLYKNDIQRKRVYWSRIDGELKVEHLTTLLTVIKFTAKETTCILMANDSISSFYKKDCPFSGWTTYNCEVVTHLYEPKQWTTVCYDSRLPFSM
uniref:Lipocalin n=1 Tax=Trichuris muris TaxID=70415 RepID=A0A5S6Q9D6_TRIMR